MSIITKFSTLILHLSTVDSTSEVAKQLLQDHPFVVVSADVQTAGRGRNGKAWMGDSGANVYVSYGYKHAAPKNRQYLVDAMFFPALAVVATLRELDSIHTYRIKYPNDIQITTPSGWAKISGILTEHEFEGPHCVTTTIGIGINVRQTVFPDTITQPCTSLLAQNVDVSVRTVLEVLHRHMSNGAVVNHTDLYQRWLCELELQGTEVHIVGSEHTWNVCSVEEDGRLLVQNTVTHEQRVIDNGDTIRYID
ncbi:MAG: hypothetical protein RLZZ273_770 [Bacteroidota bacterium]|jgi:BirA family biotin operon repressor/biotin-[acetyl-CoA-carboxylase] ligase